MPTKVKKATTKADKPNYGLIKHYYETDREFARRVKEFPRRSAAAKKAAATRKANEAKANEPQPLAAPLAALTPDQADWLAKQVMAHPGGCDDGKRTFIKKLGLPAQPRMAKATVTIVVPVVGATSGAYGPNPAQRTKIQKDLAEALGGNKDFPVIQESVSVADYFTDRR